MFETIVVGTDGSATATEAVQTAARLALAHGSRLHIVSSYTGSMNQAQAKMVVGGGDSTPVVGMTEAEVRQLGVAPQTHVLTGDPAECLVDTAEKLQADLVVVGNQGMSQGVRGRFLSSIPEQVAKSAPCAVLIVPTG